ncbi:RabGAP/TBC [Suhomyces tanzawaensis NRRL Y-17324]|uniref:RabGAP/TBC n=1 Tax=Suhomyces tanzawaensis NRRL Y-17324 TaxID=984487 RepID=A0A1E4SHU5_9ASCO|nr:RabGAP/TBC [Suhomyces tanzawaensis NRRL Y-17324]ODV79017.1 RabGAP/TBC [Suhomyces tanzawaensis NRRL Y-17324]
MGKKKQEMAQVYSNSNNEFIFGENGGRGKHLSSFLKNLSLTGSSASKSPSSSTKPDDYQEANSNIYGSLAWGAPKGTGGMPRGVSNSGSIISSSLKRTPTQRSVSLGTPSAHRSPTREEYTKTPGSSSRRRSQSNSRYADLDDDWDAGLDEVSVVPKQPENRNFPMLDSLYPDLTLPSASSSTSNLESPKKESMDFEDYQAKLEINKLNQLNSKYSKFRKVLTTDSSINLQDLRKLAWNGIPPELRALTWQILLGYLPTNKSRQRSTLKRKRQEYMEGIEAVANIDFEDDAPSNTSSTSIGTNREKQLYHQINIDVKRTHPTIKLYSFPEVQLSLRKILYLWAVRHPASGYVQGINDLCTPFFQIFLGHYLWQLQRKASIQKQGNEAEEDLFIQGLMDDTDTAEQALLQDPRLGDYTIDTFNPKLISSRVLSLIEADTYWCLSRLLENITDNYIHEQPGILRQVGDLKNLISRIDIELLNHFDHEGIEFIQFAFRWMNCLLMREVSINLITRMWDTYLSETPLGFNNFHVYVCAAFLVKFSSELKHMDFQEILLFLQNPPTQSWTEKDVELMLSEAFIWQSLYKNASAHLRN